LRNYFFKQKEFVVNESTVKITHAYACARTHFDHGAFASGVYLGNCASFAGASDVSHRISWKQGILKFVKIFF
jgi:hypothetical protein